MGDNTTVYDKADRHSANRYRSLMREAVRLYRDREIHEAQDRMRYAEQCAWAMWTLTKDPGWRRRARWSQLCQAAMYELLVEQVEGCICGGGRIADTWRRIKGASPDDFEWYEDGEKRVQCWERVDDERSRMVVWVEHGEVAS